MLTHYADTVAMRRALVAGKIADYRTAAAAVGNDEWTPRMRGDYRAYVDAVRSVARTAAKASSFVEGAAVLGKLGEACAACHLELNTSRIQVAPEQPDQADDPSMVAHAAAVERLWEGLVLPSDLSWSSGIEVLIDAPRLDSDVADVAAAAGRVRDLARQGKSADVAQRRQIFANLLTTCAGCHERLGVALRPAPSR
jgi:cytochrome c553